MVLYPQQSQVNVRPRWRGAQGPFPVGSKQSLNDPHVAQGSHGHRCALGSQG